MAEKGLSPATGGLEEYPKSVIIFGNFMMLLWITLGTITCYFISPLAAVIYLTTAITTVFLVLRKLVCVNCYYYGKWCATGWGKLTALLFKQGSLDNFSRSAGVRLAPVIYGLLSLIPLVLGAISLIQKFSVLKLVVLLLLFAVSFYSGAISRGKACVNCKMRNICPGAPKK